MFFLLWSGVLFTLEGKRRRIVEHDHFLGSLATNVLYYHLALGANVLGYLVQGGLYEFTALASIAFYFMQGVVLAQILRFMLRMAHPVLTPHVNRFHERVDALVGASLVSHVCFALPTTFALRTRYSDVFVAMSCISFGGFILVFTVLAWSFTTKFLDLLSEAQKLSDGGPAARIPRALQSRVEKMRYYVMIQALCGVAVALLMIPIRFFLGSIPFFWVVLMPCVAAANLLTLGVASLFATEDDERKLAMANVHEPWEEEEDCFHNIDTRRDSAFEEAAAAGGRYVRRRRRQVNATGRARKPSREEEPSSSGASGDLLPAAAFL